MPSSRRSSRASSSVRRRRRDGHVEAAHLVDGVVVDLREDDLLPDAEREVAAAVERVRVDARGSRGCAAARRSSAGRGTRTCESPRSVTLSPIAMPSRILKPAIDFLALVITRLLAGDQRRAASAACVERLAVVLASPTPMLSVIFVMRGTCIGRRAAEALLQARADLLVVAGPSGAAAYRRLAPSVLVLDLAVAAACTCGSWSRPSSVPEPTRVGLSHDGHTSTTFETSIGCLEVDHAAGRHLRAARAA